MFCALVSSPKRVWLWKSADERDAEQAGRDDGEHAGLSLVHSASTT
jgi:hypothetical protein